MKSLVKATGFGLPLMLAAAGALAAPAAAQDPVLTPIIVDTAVPIIVSVVKPKPKNTGLSKFQGYVQHANIAQITARARGNDLSLQTFSLSPEASAKMQQIVDKGGYQYGDKVVIQYKLGTDVALNIKGKPSKPI